MYQLVDGMYELMPEQRDTKHQCAFVVTGQDIENIVLTALEGGIGYWAMLDNTTADWDNKPKGLPTSQYATQLLLERKTLRFFDAEDDIVYWELTLKQLFRGVNEFINTIHDTIENIDAEDADVIFQYAIFDKVVFS